MGRLRWNECSPRLTSAPSLLACSEFKMMLKERASGMYRLSAFYLARSASDMPIELSAPSTLIILVYWMVGPYLACCDWLIPTIVFFSDPAAIITPLVPC